MVSEKSHYTRFLPIEEAIMLFSLVLRLIQDLKCYAHESSFHGNDEKMEIGEFHILDISPFFFVEIFSSLTFLPIYSSLFAISMSGVLHGLAKTLKAAPWPRFSKYLN